MSLKAALSKTDYWAARRGNKYEVPVTRPPQPHAEQQAEEGEGCEGLAEHWYDIVREG